MKLILENESDKNIFECYQEAAELQRGLLKKNSRGNSKATFADLDKADFLPYLLAQTDVDVFLKRATKNVEIISEDAP